MKKEAPTRRSQPAIPSWIFLAVGFVIGYGIRGAQRPAIVTTVPSSVSVLFSPGGGCTAAIVEEISKAKKEVLIQAYSFTSRDVAEAVSRKARQGVKVEAVLDASNRTAHYSAATFLSHASVQVFIDDAHHIAHNKVIVIDAETVITGSFNFTRAAEQQNAENLLILHDAKIARAYRDNYLKHRAHSTPYGR